MKGVWQERVEMGRARAEVYGFFSRVFLKRPREVDLNRLLAAETLDALGALYGDHPSLNGLRDVADEWSRGRLDPEEIQVQYDNLFLVPGPHYVPPYESVLLGDDAVGGAGRRGTLFGRKARRIASIYEEHGLGPSEGLDEFPDHIGVELAFMEYLCRRAAEAHAARDVQAAEFLENAASSFLREHLHAFSQRFASAIVEKGLSPTYEALAGLLASFLEDDLNEVSSGPDRRWENAVTCSC
ncbi:MAG: molecular chaperone TorD family protein [Desulfacinum sp.]|jgi:TorA maturation chaperone TorD|nr:molecular chaperone TorD family protein [Desulfacinum sp.]